MKIKPKIPYIRIATTYHKIVLKPTIHGEMNECLTAWNYETIARDAKAEQLDVISYCKQIPKFDGMTCIPSHTNHQQVYGTFYNTYAPLEHIPQKGDVSYTLKYLHHVFGEQVEIALDYLRILYEQPTQILPILCLVSEERNTGKTTFLKWLKMIYASNMSYLDNHNIGSRFNSDWMGKLVVGVEETLIRDDSLIEILKNISTADKYNSESKGKDRVEVDMFLKIVLCSNRERDLLKIDEKEIRFWVVKVPVIQKNDINVNLLLKMKDEIPAFLDYIMTRPMHTAEPLTRMWFTPEQLETKALRRMRIANKAKLELELATVLLLAMEDLEVNEIHLTPDDARKVLGKPTSQSLEFRQLLKQKWNLTPQNNSNSYKQLVIESLGYQLRGGVKGRYFTVTKLFLTTHFDDLMN